MDTDIIVVGGGPAGLAFARQFKNSRLHVTVIEKAPLESLQNPAYDGREIALTHLSREIMQKLGMWQRIPENEIYRLRDAKVYKWHVRLHIDISPNPKKHVVAQPTVG